MQIDHIAPICTCQKRGVANDSSKSTEVPQILLQIYQGMFQYTKAVLDGSVVSQSIANRLVDNRG